MFIEAFVARKAYNYKDFWPWFHSGIRPHNPTTSQFKEECYTSAFDTLTKNKMKIIEGMLPFFPSD